jgi:hypothetical protein
MQIKIEIDVKPEELRRFLGLPDVGALQDDIVDFLREKAGEVADSGAGTFVKSNLDALKTMVTKVVTKDSSIKPSAAPAKKQSRKKSKT